MSDPTIKGLAPSGATFDGSALRIGIVHARWNDAVISPLVEGCVRTLKAHGVKAENIVIKTVPGSYELPFATKALIEGSKTQHSNAAPSMLASTTNLLSLIETDKPASPAPGAAATASSPTAASGAGASKPSTAPFNAVISIGCLLKGSTMHFEYICDAVSQGLMRVGLDTGTPVIFGVLTCLTEDQALERAGVGRNGNKGHNHGEDWAAAAVELSCQSLEWGKGNI